MFRRRIDVCQSGSRHVERVANTPEALRAWIARARPALVGMEPTGGYERALCSAFAEAGVRYMKLHPNTILAFRKAQGLRAKTDRIDAMLIARYLADAVRRADLPATFRADERLRVAGRPAQAVGRRPPGGRLPRRSGERSDRPGEPGDHRRGVDPKP